MRAPHLRGAGRAGHAEGIAGLAARRGHLAGEPVPKQRINAPVIKPAPGKKYDDFQLAYALDLVNGTMTVASATEAPTNTAAARN